jgi:hypothetical protein
MKEKKNLQNTPSFSLLSDEVSLQYKREIIAIETLLDPDLSINCAGLNDLTRIL